MKKLKLTHIPGNNLDCIQHPHYDLHTDEKEPQNVACILTDKDGVKLLRKWIKQHNKEV